jgi:hypothetical protein
VPNKFPKYFLYSNFRILSNFYFYLFFSQAMAANSETYEKGFHQHQEVLEEVMTEKQVPLQPYQVVQYGE